MTAGRVLAGRLGPVGLWTSLLDMQPTEQVRAAVAELEELGWRSLWCWEVLGREALTNAGLLLATSRRMVIGTGIASIWSRDPAALANAQRTLAEAYPDRFVLGVGVSHGPLVDARGHRYQRPLATMRAYLDAMDAALWQGPPLQEQPPRVLAALGPRMLALAAEQAIAERVRAQLDAGADHVCLQVLGPDPDGVPMAGWRALAAALLSR
jgi:probable F420-dependent oxidoreductase